MQGLKGILLCQYWEGFGEILARGIVEAAELIGGDAPNFCVHAKGTGIPLHDWRQMWGKLLGVIVGSNSGHGAHGGDSGGPEPDAGYLQRTFGPTHLGKAEEVYKTGPLKQYQDSVGICWFAAASLPVTDLVVEALSAATGWDYTKEELLTAGERISQVERAFNVRHGLKPEDDFNVGPRMLEAPTWGLAKGKALGDYLKGMIEEYYKLMDWDLKTGKPYRKILKALDLEKEARDLWGEF